MKTPPVLPPRKIVLKNPQQSPWPPTIATTGSVCIQPKSDENCIRISEGILTNARPHLFCPSSVWTSLKLYAYATNSEVIWEPPPPQPLLWQHLIHSENNKVHVNCKAINIAMQTKLVVLYLSLSKWLFVKCHGHQESFKLNRHFIIM